MNYFAFVITCAFIVFDFVTGIVKAFSSGSYKSTMMRQGLFHKVGLLLCVVLGYMVDYAQGYLELSTTVPVAGAICAYIVMMEICSSLENLCRISPALMPEKLTGIFGAEVHKEEKDEDQ